MRIERLIGMKDGDDIYTSITAKELEEEKRMLDKIQDEFEKNNIFSMPGGDGIDFKCLISHSIFDEKDGWFFWNTFFTVEYFHKKYWVKFFYQQHRSPNNHIRLIYDCNNISEVIELIVHLKEIAKGLKDVDVKIENKK